MRGVDAPASLCDACVECEFTVERNYQNGSF